MTLLDSSQPAPDQSAPAALPDAHALFPDIEEHHEAAAGASGHLPDANDLFPDMPEPAPRRPITGAVAPGPVGDWIFGNTQHSSLARIMDAFGTTVDQDIGHYGEKLGLSEETSKALRDKGIFNDYAQGQHNIGKALNETLLRSGAVLVNGAIYGIPAVWHGLAEAVVEAGEQAQGTELGKAVNARGAARSLAAIPEAFPDFNFGPGNTKAYGQALMRERAPVPAPLAAARDLNVIGPGGEAAWKGIASSDRDIAPGGTPLPEILVEETGGPTVPVEAAAAEALPSTPAAAPDVHAIARSIAPETFTEFDALEKRRDLFRKWIDDGGAQVPPNIAQNLKETEARLRELEPKVTAAYTKAKEGLPAITEAENAGGTEAANPATGGTPEARAAAAPAPAPEEGAVPAEGASPSRVAGEAGAEAAPLIPDWVRENRAAAVETANKLGLTDQIATLAREGKTAKEISEALGERLSTDEVRAVRESLGIEAAGPLMTPGGSVLPREAAPRSIEDQRDHIVNEVKQSLIDAGRPSEEAQAAAQLVAARYEARAARFNGALGTPQQLFDRESSDIRRMERVAKSTKRLINPNSARALDDFQERMAQAKELRRKATESGGGSARIMSAEERFAGVTEGEWKAQLEDSIEALEPEERQSVREDLSHLPAEDLAYLAERAEAGLPLFQIEAYHGSPHHFERFDISKIGTGEGAQAYGHGLYFAENEGVARSYAKTLAAKHAIFSRQQLRDMDEAVAWLRGGRVGEISAAAKQEIEYAKGDLGVGEATDAQIADHLAGSHQAGQSLYRVSLKPDKEDLLDWDKPLSEQSEKVKAAIKKLPLSESDMKDILGDQGFSGMHLVQALNWHPSAGEGSAIGTSTALREAGIPGIKYADQGSRRRPAIEAELRDARKNLAEYERLGKANDMAFEGQLVKRLEDELANYRETHNFVIFDDKDVEITHRNGEALSKQERADAVQELYQRPELNQKALGSFQIIEGERPILKLAKSANASTFIHESGHEWLEQLMRDDAHPLAPADLKADAKTVRDWLGIENHQDLNTGWPGERGQKARAAHEKFARGFEQYLRLGVAPSPQLAAVFAKFKAWLTRLYQTLKGLGEPINEDIRGVFDRMLASEPQRVVAGAEREEAPGFHNLAASLAESTEPAKAADVADKIQSERDFHATQDMINSYDERLANVEPGTGGRAAGTPQPPGHGTQAGPEARTAGNDPENGSLGAGGSEVATASPGASAPAGGGQGVKSEIPAGPNAKFATPPSDFIDKAGNIRLDKLATPEDVTSVIRMAARENNDFLQERRGVLSDGATLELADALGMDPVWLDRKKIGDAFNVEEIRAARRLLVQSATDVRDAMIAAKPEDEASMRNLAEIMARHEMIQGKVSGATAEAGRALAAFREVIAGGEEALDFNSWLKQNTGRTLFQLQQMAKFGKDLTSASQVSKFVHDTANGKVKQAIIYYYVNALISGPVTHARYFAGNALTALWAPLVKTPIAAAVSGTRAILGYEDAQRVYLGEAGAELYALGKGSREGWKAAREGWETGNTPNLPGEGAPELFGTQPMIPPIPGKIGYAIGLPGKAVGAIHGFSSAVRYEQEIAKLAYRQAMQEGLSGDAFTNRVADLGNRPTAEVTEAASKVARSDLYMAPTEYDSLAGKLTRAANHNVLTKIIVPFMKIGTQITRNALIEQSPLGVFDKKVRANLSGANGDAARATQAASIIGGTALMGTMAMMTAEGVATGDGPSDPGKRAVWLLSHHPNSIQIGSVTIPYKGLGSLGMLMSLAANAYETHQGWGDEEGHSVALDYLHGFEKAVLDESFMRGVKDMIDAVYHFEEYGDRYIASMVTNWIPFSVGLGQLARTSHFLGIPNPAGDEFQRETRGNSLGEMILKEAEAKVPWLSQNLMPRRDMFGEPIPSSGPVQNYANDRTAKVMDDLHMKVGRLPHKIRGVQLSDQQFDDFSRIAGKTAKMRLDSMMKTTGQHLLHAGQTEDRVKLAELMHKIITQSREEASKTVMMHAYGSDNDIQAKATEAKKVKKGIIPAPTVH